MEGVIFDFDVIGAPAGNWAGAGPGAGQFKSSR